MTKIGLIIDKYHLEKKVNAFLQHSKRRAKVSIYLEESFLLDFSEINFEEDIFFVKGKGDLILSLIKLIENETSIPVINSSRGIWLSCHRFMASLLLAKTGIDTPDYGIIPVGIHPPFEDYIIKNVVDQKNYALKANIKKKDGHLNIIDERALTEAFGGTKNYHFFYYQKFIKTKWEYKVYSIGDKYYFYKQIPVLIDADKMKSRKEINPISELKDKVKKIKEIFDIKIISVDFLKSIEGKFYVTDVNSIPNFNYIKNGPKIVTDFLIDQAKK
ncbi:MAG: hypothetical protein ACFE8E_03495 [Candidatus Hodarchaeota archaeon]